ncbi:hypothetical protein GQ53DRAFT_155143 [Thozetella sp. PMI_491]|nr:hypothetical protein GQ53DRAFT_155143 [Thozetella sp. PMI_491]
MYVLCSWTACRTPGVLAQPIQAGDWHEQVRGSVLCPPVHTLLQAKCGWHACNRFSAVLSPD